MDKFLEHITKGFDKFGVEVMSSEELKDGLQKMMLNDSVNNVYYAALARRKDASSPAKFWGKALDEVLTPLIKSASDGEGAILPSALVVPSVEAEVVLKLAADRGASPTIYQLFDGYTVVGFKRSDSAALIRNLSPEKHEIKEEKAPEKTKQTERGAEKERSSISPRKLAAAALLGVSIASIPFALHKIRDTQPESISEEAALSPEDAFIKDNIIEGAIEGRGENKELLAALALKSDMGGENLKELSRSGYRLEVAANPHIGRVAEELISSHDKALRAGGAANPSISKELAARAAEDSAAEVRRKAAANPQLPPDALRKLALDKDISVRSAALENPNATEEILALVEPVFESASCDNIQKIYASPCMPQNRLSYHSKNPDPCVRRGIAQNPHAPEAALKELAEDKDLGVKRGALANPSFKDIDVTRYFPVGWLAEDSMERREERKALLSNPNIPPGLLKSAVLENPKEYGVAVAHNPKTPASLINALYNYAKGRGGVSAFFKELSELPSNAKFAAEYRKAKARSPEEGERLLKGAVKKSFNKNVFDPVKAVAFAKGEDPGKRESKLALGDFTESASEFFEEEALLAEGEGGFEEFFGDEDLTGFEKETLKTADKAVDGALAELRPALDGGAASGGIGSGGAGGGSGRGGSGGSASSASHGSGTGTGGTRGGATSPEVGGVAGAIGSGGVSSPFSADLFQTTCEDIDKLRMWGAL